MPSDVGICNQALNKLGAARITALTDTDKNARHMASIYEVKRDAELAAHPWTFAITRVSIPASSTAPAFKWLRSFPLPSDCLRLVEVGQDFDLYDSETGARFQVEGNAILTDEASPLQIRYVARVTNTGYYPAPFVEALACRLAAESAEALTQNATKREAAWNEHKQAIKEARRLNAIEQPPQRTPMNSWERVLVQG